MFIVGCSALELNQVSLAYEASGLPSSSPAEKHYSIKFLFVNRFTKNNCEFGTNLFKRVLRGGKRVEATRVAGPFRSRRLGALKRF